MNALIIAVFAILTVANALPSGHPLGAPINLHALSPIGPSGIVTGQGVRGPSGIVTGTAAVGPSGIVTGLGPVGPTGPAGHGTLFASPALAHASAALPLASHSLPLAAPALGLIAPPLGLTASALAHAVHALPLTAPGLGLTAPFLPHGPLGFASPKITVGYGLGLGHGIH